jgi:hypothetical protein
MVNAAGVLCPINVEDRDYARPKEMWLLSEFYPWWIKYQGKRGLDSFSVKNKCSDWTRRFAVDAQWAHFKSSNTAEGIAVGEFWFNRFAFGMHAVAICICEKDNPIFIDPLNHGSKLNLTHEEISSATFCRF